MAKQLKRKKNLKTYSELMKLPTYEERVRYLMRGGKVGEDTFGNYRYICQKFYHSYEWQAVKKIVKLRDKCLDLGIEDRPIDGKIFIHHINPITIDDIFERRPLCTDPENLICCGFMTHQAIHYSDESILYTDPVERTPNDTCPWRNCND